ncbi:hypothetical protein ACHWQZ_G000094 [Mnemiopsis leidyi]
MALVVLFLSYTFAVQIRRQQPFLCGVARIADQPPTVLFWQTAKKIFKLFFEPTIFPNNGIVYATRPFCHDIYKLKVTVTYNLTIEVMSRVTTYVGVLVNRWCLYLYFSAVYSSQNAGEIKSLLHATNAPGIPLIDHILINIRAKCNRNVDDTIVC